MSTRTQRVEQMLRRTLADMLLRGELRDPRLRNVAAISVTAVKVSPDLGHAQVYVDVIAADSTPGRRQPDPVTIVEALNSGASALRARLGGRIRLKRTPALSFLVDESIEKGRRIEAVIAELHAEQATAAPIDDPGDEASGESEPDES